MLSSWPADGILVRIASPDGPHSISKIGKPRGAPCSPVRGVPRIQLAHDRSSRGGASLDTVARAKGMSNVAKATGLGRESLYKSLGGTTKPEFDTIQKVVNAFGVKLVARPIRKSARSAT